MFTPRPERTSWSWTVIFFWITELFVELDGDGRPVLSEGDNVESEDEECCPCMRLCTFTWAWLFKFEMGRLWLGYTKDEWL